MNKLRPYQPERSSNKAKGEQVNQLEEIKPKSKMSVRNKIIWFLVSLIVLILIILGLVYLNGGNINILADRAQYVSKDPGKAAANLIEHGNVKGETGIVCGTVRSQYNSIISGAKVEISGGQIDWSTQTDSSGQFCIPPLNKDARLILGEILVGDYQIKVSAPGYNSDSKETTIDSGEKKELKFYLSLSKDKMLPKI
jgi:hypothetical protein